MSQPNKDSLILKQTLTETDAIQCMKLNLICFKVAKNLVLQSLNHLICFYRIHGKVAQFRMIVFLKKINR